MLVNCLVTFEISDRIRENVPVLISEFSDARGKGNEPGFKINIIIGKLNGAETIKYSLGGTTFYAVDLANYEHVHQILSLENISPEEVLMAFSTGPGSILDYEIPQGLRDHFPLAIRFGDLHHLENPLSFAHQIIDIYKPDYCHFQSCAHLGAVICAINKVHGGPHIYSVRNESVTRTHSRKIREAIEVVWHGSTISRFHPRRSKLFSDLQGQIKISVVPFQDQYSWYWSISPSSIYLHASLNSQFSHHLWYPLERGSVLLVDRASLANRFNALFLRDGETCLTYGTANEIPSILDTLSSSQLDEITASAALVIRDIFPVADSAEQLELTPQARFLKAYFLAERERYVKACSALSRTECNIALNVMEVLQEIHRFLFREVNLHTKSCPKYGACLSLFAESFSYFVQVDGEVDPSIPTIFLEEESSNSPDPIVGKYLRFSIANVTKNGGATSFFDFGDFLTVFDGFFVEGDHPVFRQQLHPGLRVSSS